MTFSDREFRDALGLFPTGVVVVSALRPDGTPLGATVSSFNSVSLSPPLVLFSIARSAAAFESWSTVDRYAINVLPEGLHALATKFARARTDKWADIAPLTGLGGVPLVPGASAWFDCENYGRYDGGDHLILVGRVVGINVAAAPEHNRPLVFYRGNYAKLQVWHVEKTPSDLEHLLHGW